MDRLEVGCAYRATLPAIHRKHRPNKVVIVAGRQGSKIQLAWVEDFTIGDADCCSYGSEFCQSYHNDQLYTVSAACKIESTTVQDVLDLIRSHHNGNDRD